MCVCGGGGGGFAIFFIYYANITMYKFYCIAIIFL